MKILEGIVLLASGEMVSYMNEHVAGITVPRSLIDEMASAPQSDALKKDVEIAGSTVPEDQGRWPRKRGRHHGNGQ